MRKTIIIALLMIAGIYSSFNCNKFKDLKYPDIQNPQKEFDLCRITEIHQSAGPLVTDRTGVFYYSSKGNLDSVVFNDDRGIIHYWKYDDQNVLVEYREAFDHDITDFRTLHRYASQNGRVIRDTTWLEGASGYIIQVWTLQYDDKDRVIKETGIRIDDEAPGTPLPDRIYLYNEQGNLGDNPYDNEENYLRTNKVLQFVHRNYSMNNEKAYVLGYNEYHLPLGFRMGDIGFFLGGSIPSKLSYACTPIPPYGNPKEQCRFASMEHLGPNNLIFDGTFYYTPEGLPLSVQYIQRNNNSEANTHIFQYNKKNELIGYQIVNGISVFVQHSYGYTNKKLTLDTLYNDFGEQFIQISTLQYDKQGRIIKEDIHVIERNLAPVSEYSTKEYVYNSAGNLVSPLVTSYDNKTNYLRINPLWMFIHRNYSLNNPQGVTGYNSENLPLGFKGTVFGFLDYGEPRKIEYLCNSGDPGNNK